MVDTFLFLKRFDLVQNEELRYQGRHVDPEVTVDKCDVTSDESLCVSIGSDKC